MNKRETVITLNKLIDMNRKAREGTPESTSYYEYLTSEIHRLEALLSEVQTTDSLTTEDIICQI